MSMKSLFYDKHFGDSKKWKEGKNEEKSTCFNWRLLTSDRFDYASSGGNF